MIRHPFFILSGFFPFFVFLQALLVEVSFPARFLSSDKACPAFLTVPA